VKLKYIIGVLALLLLMVGTASAQPFILTETTNDYTYGVPIKVLADYDPTANTLTLTVIEPQNKEYPEKGYTISNVDLKNIWIKTAPGNVDVTSPSIWNDPTANNGEIGNFGEFTTQISKPNNKEYKSPGPVTIQLSGVTLDELIANSGDGYVVAVHVAFDKNGAGGYTDCSGKVRGNTEIPEFSSIAVPVAAILGLMFIFGRRKQE
jgi:hypothetical protein